MGLPDTFRIAHVVMFVLEERHALCHNYEPLRPRVLMTMLREDSRGIFHLYTALPPCYDVPVLKASSI